MLAICNALRLILDLILSDLCFLFLDIVTKELFKLAESSLVGFPNLIKTAQVLQESAEGDAADVSRQGDNRVAPSRGRWHKNQGNPPFASSH